MISVVHTKSWKGVVSLLIKHLELTCGRNNLGYSLPHDDVVVCEK